MRLSIPAFFSLCLLGGMLQAQNEPIGAWPSAEGWTFENSDSLPPTAVTLRIMGDTWVLVSLEGQQRYLPYGKSPADLKAGQELVVSGRLGMPPGNIRMIGQPLLVRQVMPLTRAKPEDK
jgi:hypothetical protein